MQTQGEKQVWKCSTSYEGNKKIVKIQNPYWMYYDYGKGNNPNIGGSMLLYFTEYSYLLDRGSLTQDEENFMKNLAEFLSAPEPEAIANYVLEVTVRTNDKRDSFICNLRLSDDCK